jgi:multisubunit Na+/H+ antiporter MnhE subunit
MMIQHNTLGNVFIIIGSILLLCVVITEVYVIISGEFTSRNVLTALIVTAFLIFIWYRNFKTTKTQSSDNNNSVL